MRLSPTIDGVIYVWSDNVIMIDGLHNARTGDWINDAAVTATLKDHIGNELSGVTWPVSGTYDPGTNGDYQIPIPAAVVVTVGQVVEAVVQATSGGQVLTWNLRIKAELRTN